MLIGAEGSGLPVTLLPRRASQFPLMPRAMLVGLSKASITTSIPTAASCAWMNCASRSLGLVSDVDRCTVGFENPDEAMSCLACLGSYGVHGMVVASYQAMFEGPVGVHPTCTRPPKTTLFSVFRSIASSNACRSFALDPSGVFTRPYGSWPIPFLLPMLISRPCQPSWGERIVRRLEVC